MAKRFQLTMIKNCTAVILAGGESRRMGRDKAQVEFQGETLLHRAITNLSPLFEEIVLSVHQPVAAMDLLQSNVMQVIDAGEQRGPMMGIMAGLEYASTDWVFAIGVDMPFVVPAVLHAMAEQRCDHDVVLAEIEGHLQPMPAFYAKKVCLPAMQSRLEQGKRSLMRLIPSLSNRILTADDLRPFDPDLRSFTDFDTPEDLTAGELSR